MLGDNKIERKRGERPDNFVISFNFANFGEEGLEQQVLLGGGGGFIGLTHKKAALCLSLQLNR